MINLGFSPMMATAKKNPYYFKTFTGVFRFWSFNYQDWTGNYDEVDLCIGAPDNYRTDWDGVKRWLRGDSEQLPLMKTMKCVAEQTDLYDQRIKEELEHASTDYKYEERVCDGIFFAEIRKPEAGQVEVTPYTVVIEAWTPDKMPYMFSSICSVPSFGTLYPADRNFIVSLWKYKNMEGDFNLQALADKHVKAVKHGHMHEPVVYRKSVGEVIDQFNDMASDVGTKRKRIQVPCK